MRKYLNGLGCIFLIVFALSSCVEDRDDVLASTSSIKNFVYRGMNVYYLYKDDVAELQNGRFSSVDELEAYHEQFATPEDFFYSLRYQPQTVDKFSVIVPNYVELEQQFSGTSKNNGMEFGLVAVENDPNKIFGYVRYVLPNSDAFAKGIQRGLFFNEINNTQLTRNNFRDLLNQDTYTIGLGDLDNGDVTSNGQEIELVKTTLEENPVFITSVLDRGPVKVGYLMYTSFTAEYDEQLNQAFQEFKSAGVTQLVLDLRYNGGGSVNSAVILGSLISGIPTTDVFSTEQWNSQIQEQFEQQNPERLVNYFKTRTNAGTALSTLDLSTVYIIATGSSASASELVINALDPYINVIHVGSTTLGKYQASITLYDSSNLSRVGVNPSHSYALQPLVLKSGNSVGNTDYFDGLTPDIELREQLSNLGTLGNPLEPLLERCLLEIDQNPTGYFPRLDLNTRDFDLFSDSKSLKPFANDMYIDQIPELKNTNLNPNN